MLSTCLNASERRHDGVNHVSSLLKDAYGVEIERIAEMHRFADENVRECMDSCDNYGNVTLCSENGEEFKILCPLRSKDCGYGETVRSKAKIHAIESLNDVVPKRLQKSLAKPVLTSALSKACKWDFTGILYLSGGTGVGKSFCAAWLLYERRLQQLMKNWDNEYAWGVKDTGGIAWISAYSAVDKANFELVKNIHTLVLDDLGKEAITPVNKATIGEIISKRYDNDIPTIITSNLGLTVIDNKLSCETLYGRHIVDRIIQSGMEICFNGASMRVSAA